MRDAELFWKLNPKGRGGSEISAQGFRGFKIFSLEKPVGTFRIICLGDSVPYGMFVSAHESYPAVLEQTLNKVSGQKIEVINAGVPGYSSLQGLRYLKRDLLKYHPDLLLAHFGPDDGQDAAYFVDKELPISPQWIVDLQNGMGRTQIYSLLSRIIFYFTYKFRTRVTMRPRVSSNDYKKNLTEMAEVGVENGFETILLPSLLQEDKRGIFSHYPLPENIKAVNNLKSFQENNKNGPLFFDICHLTISGNQLMAATIADFLFKNNVLKKKPR